MMSSIGPVVSEEKMFENVDGRAYARVIGMLIAHLGAISELKINCLRSGSFSCF